MFVCVRCTRQVGAYVNTVGEGQRIVKGQEMGYFKFGGSTVLAVFQRGAITFDKDLLLNSQKPIETYVRVATRNAASHRRNAASFKWATAWAWRRTHR